MNVNNNYTTSVGGCVSINDILPFKKGGGGNQNKFKNLGIPFGLYVDSLFFKEDLLNEIPLPESVIEDKVFNEMLNFVVFPTTTTTSK